MGKRNIVVILLIFVLVFTSTKYVTVVSADSMQDLRAQQEQAESEAAELEQKKQALESALGDLNSELYTVSANISQLEDEAAACEKKIAKATKDLAAAEEKAQQQYEDMKLRIQFMYENGSDNLLVTLLDAGSFAEFLNRVDYINALSGYDRSQLEDYQATQQAVADYKQELEEEQAELVAKQEELQKQEKTLLSSISTTQANIDATNDDIDARKKRADALADKIKAMEEYERKLEEQRAKEEAERLAAQSDGSSGSAGKQKVSKVAASASEQDILAALIYCEAGGESYKAQVAVGSVVINRIHSSSFPNSMTGVIYQSGQFSPASSGKLALVLENNLTTDSCRKAAKQVLNGNISGNWLYFCLNTGSIKGTVIGRQVFY